MRQIPLPNTTLSLTPLGLGTWALGGLWWGEPTPEDQALATLRAALDLGINWVDTAPLYGHGRVDSLLRQALGPRLQELIVATKVGVRWQGRTGHAESDLSPAHIVEDCEASLRRLGLERIPLLQVHWPCERGTPLEDSLEALTRLQAQGKVQHIGLCNYDAETLRRAQSLAPIVSLQTPYSLLRREFEGPLREACAGRTGVLAYEPLCRGLLSGRFRDAPVFPSTDQRSWDERFQGQRVLKALALVEDLRRFALRLNLPPAALAIGWVMRQPGVSAVLAGARSPAQLRENVQATQLSEKAASVLGRLAALHSV